jgi:glycosyltransferase involved in cell wall biosynthesis
MDVNVLFISYNSAEQIGRGSGYVFSQTGFSFELSVVENASDDETIKNSEPTVIKLK